MACRGYMRTSVYLISFFLLSVFQMSQKSLWQVTIRDDRLNSHVPDFLFTWFHNGSCHPFFLCGCRFFPRGIMVCYRMGRAISITTMNYSVAIFVYSPMIRYPDNAITELRYSRERREHAPFRIQISQNLHLQKCRSSNPLMDNRACKGQISRIFASLSPNYGRKSHGYGDISIL